MYLFFRPSALSIWRDELPQWQKERVSERAVGLLHEPRPRAAQSLVVSSGEERYEVWQGDLRIVYSIYKDDDGHDVLIGVLRIEEYGS